MITTKEEAIRKSSRALNRDGVRIFRKFKGKYYKYVEVHNSKSYAENRAARLRASINRSVRIVKVKMPSNLTIYHGGAWVIYAEMRK